MRKTLWTLALLTILAVTPLTQKAQAWGGIRIGIGLPLYVGPGPYYYGYGYPYRYYYPPPYVVPAPAVVVQAPPTVVQSPAPPTSEAIPNPPMAYSTPSPLPAITNVTPVSNQSSPQIDALIRQLSQANDTARRDAALQLGRLKANVAVEALMSMLAKDSSPVARDGAARALGLIASPATLRALIYAAQADDDREVRHSAQFAVEVIRNNLRGR